MKKRVISILMAGVMVGSIALAGCGNSASGSVSGGSESESVSKTGDQAGLAGENAFVGSEDEVYYLETFLCGYDYWTSYYEGFMDAAKQLGVNTKYVGATTSETEEQVKVFQQIMASNPAGIMVNPNDGTAFTSVAQECNNKGIPLVVGENPIPDCDVVMFINHDEEAMTKKAVEYIGEAMGGKGSIAMLTTPGQTNLELRDEAFKKNMEELYPDIEIVFEANTQHDNAKGASDTHQIVSSYGDVQFIFCDNPDAAMGAVTAKEEGGYDVKIITFDTNPNVLDYIKEGKLEAAVMPDPYTFGYMGLLTLYMAHHQLWDPMWDYENGDRAAIEIPLLSTSCSIVTAENADVFYSDQYKERRGSQGYDMEAKELP